nr:unnamed protein product [Callosobruchus chinensis]
MSELTGISRTSIQRILKHYKWHPYKIQLLHELNEDDHDRRLQFCVLMNTIIPALIEIMENDQRYQEENAIFQQDGAPPHYALPVRQFLEETFPDRWIGRRGPIEWPARSPDLSPLDFFFWGHLKSKIYATQPESLLDLRNRITHECQQITPDILRNVREHFEQLLYYCMEVNGGHFQHLIR